MSARFPTALATKNDLLAQVNRYSSTLTAGISDTDTSIPVAAVPTMPATSSMLVSIGSEIIKISGVVGSNLTIATGGRGYDGTSAAAHSSGIAVKATITAAHHNLLVDEIKGIEDEAGAGFTNLSKRSTFYDFAAVTPVDPISGATVALTTGVDATVKLSVVPWGIRWNDADHKLRILDAVAGNEVVSIKEAGPGTAVGGGTNQTLTLTGIALNHAAGDWTLVSATAGGQEAVSAIESSGGTGTVVFPAGSHYLRATITTHNSFISFAGEGPGITYIRCPFSGHVFDVHPYSGIRCSVGGFTFDPNDENSIPFARSSGAYVRVKTAVGPRVHDIQSTAGYDAVLLEDCNSPFVERMSLSEFTRYGIYTLAVTGAPWVSSLNLRGAACGSTKVAAIPIRIEAQAGISVAGGNLSDITLQGGSYLISLYAAATGTVNELQFTNLVLDNATYAQIVISGDGTCNGNQFAVARLGGTATGVAELHKAAQNTHLSSFQGTIAPNGGMIRVVGAKQTYISNCRLSGSGAASEIGVDVSADGGTVVDGLTIEGCTIGQAETGVAPTLNYAVQVQAGAHANIRVVGNHLQGSLAAMNYAGTPTSLTEIRNNAGIDDVRPTVASANTITLSATQLNSTYFISGNTVIKTINGLLWDGRTIALIFTHATPAGTDATGNIAIAVVPTQNRAVTLVYDLAAAKWFPLM